MTIPIVCPGCQAKYQVPDNLLGKQVKCWQCDQMIAVPAAAASAEPVLLEAEPVSDRDERIQPVRRGILVDDDLPRRPAKRRRSKGNLTPLSCLAATLAILVLLGGAALAAYVVIESLAPSTNPQAQAPQTGPQPGFFPFAPPREDAFLDRQDRLAAYLRLPEELPIHGIEFTEPPDDQTPAPLRNTTGQLTPAVNKKIKESTVYLRVKTNHGEGEGSGFFAIEQGVIVTNAHVVGMLERNAAKPESIKVIRNKGEKNETRFEATVIAVDHDNDLALLHCVQQDLPAPLVVKSALHLEETQPVFFAGFPLGEQLGQNITISPAQVSSLKKERGVLERLQVTGDMQPGNSGGPVLDADGDVVGVCVSIVRNTRINFAVPGDKVRQFLNGRLAGLTLAAPTPMEDGLHVPVNMELIDPLVRVRRAALAYWIGKPGPARPGTWTPPEAKTGDTPRQTLALEVRQQAAHGELVLPPLPAGQAYWLQPSLTLATGTQVWLSAQVYQPSPTVERKPVRLVQKVGTSWPLLLERWSSLYYPDPHGHDHHALITQEIQLTDTVQSGAGTGLAVSRQFTGFKEGVDIDGAAKMTRRLEHVATNLQQLAINVTVDAEGQSQWSDVMAKLNAVPGPDRPDLLAFREDMHRFLQALEVPLPGAVVEPGVMWKARRPAPIDATWKTIDLPRQIWSTVEADFLEVTYTYTGVRTVNGAEQAVIQLEGRVVQQASGGADSGARLSGTAVVDVATGQIVEEEVAIQANVEVVVNNTAAIKAHGNVLARLRRQ